MNTFLGFLVVMFLSMNSHAAQQLQPSEVSTNDCVAVRITHGEKNSIFFTDRCSEADFFIGLDGVIYTLRRVGERPKSDVMFAGRYAGDGVDVEVTVTDKQVGKCDGMTLSQMKSSLLAGTRRVAVKVSRGMVSNRIVGTYDDCP